MSKLHLALIFGGKSTEHEISLLSATSILDQIDLEKYELTLIRIDIQGNWFIVQKISDRSGTPITLAPSEKGASLINLDSGERFKQIDVVFPVLHGVFGEDGTIQGYLKMMNVAFVGCSVMASSACMDKDLTKRVLRDAGIAIAPYTVATLSHRPDFEHLEKELGMPVFIKPANLGSSVGVFKVLTGTEYSEKLEEALQYDHKVLIEKAITGKEVECAVLGNEIPKASLPGQIIMSTGFYDFESKYVDENASSTQIPADITEAQIEEVRTTSIKAYKALGCEGLSRVDFFVSDDGQILINEINTIPGFTNISMYPKMWEASGIPYSELIDILIELAVERYQKEEELKIVAKEVE